MMIQGYEGRRVINGSFGTMWLNGEPVREVTGLKAEVELQLDEVPTCGKLINEQKTMGIKCTGSVTMNKVNSRMAILISDMIRQGKTPYFTIVSKLADPESDGAERVVLKNCVFSSLTLADWSANQKGSVTQPFSFTDWEYLDLIEPQD